MIFIVRHGESQGNVDIKNYQKIADAAFDLTEKGVQQANDAANLIQEYIDLYEMRNDLVVWNSSYKRARRTSNEIFNRLSPDAYITKRFESPLLVEKQYGLFNSYAGNKDYMENFPESRKESDRCSDHGASFFFRPPSGESDFDVFQRCEIFWNKFHRMNFQHNTNHVIVCHGLTMKLLVMAACNYEYEWFSNTPVPDNCAVLNIRGQVLEKNEHLTFKYL